MVLSSSFNVTNYCYTQLHKITTKYYFKTYSILFYRSEQVLNPCPTTCVSDTYRGYPSTSILTTRSSTASIARNRMIGYINQIFNFIIVFKSFNSNLFIFKMNSNRTICIKLK